MGLIYWLLIGFAAGAIAKMLTPQEEKGGWASSIIIGIVGSVVGGFVAGLIGIASKGLLGSLLIATAGAFLVLFIYHRYLADKLNLPI
ncbi:MAG: GlsB/YeaQ/YmgE family stress response membrane protein [Lewinellaceae bacterium]|nr:GlsB/YeaQ/YmgE family stress response membrane protein [Lewinellaceae bacterium]